VTRPAGWAAGAAVALLIAAAAGAWWPVLGGAAVRAAPVAAVAILVAAGRVSARSAGAVVLAWVPVGVLVAGIPAGRLLPGEWDMLLAELGDGAQRLTMMGGGHEGGALAVALVLGGVASIGGAALGAASSPARRGAAFAVLTAPWALAVAVGGSDEAAWQGAAVLLAGLLWFAPGRLAVRPAIALALLAAVLSVAATQAVGPRERWFNPEGLFGADPPPFRTLSTDLSFGPLGDRRTGATMLEIRSPKPALWRVQVLDEFDGRWHAGWDRPELPQAGGERVEAEVRVRGLRNDMVVAPGRIARVDGARVRPSEGEALQVASNLRRGDTYRVTADVVRASADELRRAPPPTDSRVRDYVSGGSRLRNPLFGERSDPRFTAFLNQTPYGDVLALARRLAAGAKTQFDVVERVQRYLLDGDRFRYTTDVEEPGSAPLRDFLLRDRAGYCQHFAGSAALLLRLAGVPARVAVGFATGQEAGKDRYVVRDQDAHAWIEVYFAGYGWVPFNPTPSEAEAEIADRLDPLAAAATPGAGGGPGALAGLVVAVAGAVASVAFFVRRRARRAAPQLADLLERLARRTGVEVRPSRTLTELRGDLERLGPSTAALAAEAERARFAAEPPEPVRRPRMRIARALVADLGPARALALLVVPRAALGRISASAGRTSPGSSMRT
jgi:transglutaminase-like putative cysteine protease